jgi:hypothetical protein
LAALFDSFSITDRREWRVDIKARCVALKSIPG